MKITAPIVPLMRLPAPLSTTFVRSQPWLWATLVAASLSLLLFLGPLEVLLPFVVRNDLDAGAWGYGAILSAAGAGSVLATLVISFPSFTTEYAVAAPSVTTPSRNENSTAATME